MPFRELSLDTPRGRLAGLRFAAAPGAPRVLALHGWLDNAASFVPLAAALAGAGHAVELVALDLPGHGRSEHRPPAGDYAIAGWLADVDDALDALGWAECALLGHSMGGAIASLYAAAAPERVRRLALVEAIGALSGAEGSHAARLREAMAHRRGLRGKALRVFPDPLAAVRARMQANGLDEACARLLVERGIAPVEGGFTWASDPRLTTTGPHRATEGQVREWLAAIACPVRLLAADPAPPYFDADARAARLACVPQAELRVLPGGHHLHMDQAAAAAAWLGPFLAAG